MIEEILKVNKSKFLYFYVIEVTFVQFDLSSSVLQLSAHRAPRFDKLLNAYLQDSHRCPLNQTYPLLWLHSSARRRNHRTQTHLGPSLGPRPHACSQSPCQIALLLPLVWMPAISMTCQVWQYLECSSSSKASSRSKIEGQGLVPLATANSLPRPSRSHC